MIFAIEAVLARLDIAGTTSYSEVVCDGIVVVKEGIGFMSMKFMTIKLNL